MNFQLSSPEQDIQTAGLWNPGSAFLSTMKALKALPVFIGCSLFLLSSATAQSTEPLRISGLTRSFDGAVRLEVRGIPGASFVVECSSDLHGWEALPGKRFIDWGLFEYVVQIYTLDEDGLATVMDGDAKDIPARFYRAKEFP